MVSGTWYLVLAVPELLSFTSAVVSTIVSATVCSKIQILRQIPPFHKTGHTPDEAFHQIYDSIWAAGPQGRISVYVRTNVSVLLSLLPGIQPSQMDIPSS